MAFTLQVVLTGGVLATATVAADDRERPPTATEPAGRADPTTGANRVEAEASKNDAAAPARAPGTARDAAPARSTLPKKLAPRALPKVDASGPPPAAPSRQSSSPTEGKGKKPKAGAPVEIRTPEEDFKARLGNQSARGGGVLGRYDGVMASQALGEAASLNLVGGFPLAASNDARFDLSRSFYALSLDLAPFDEKLTGRVFGVQQGIDEEQERQAIGAELGFDHARGFGLAIVDYDVDFRDIGMLSLLASTKLDDRTTVNAFVDARRYTNAQSAYSAFQDQSIASVDQLLDKLSQSEIRAPSFDSSAQTRTVTLGAARQLTSDLQLAADVTLKDVIPEPVAPSLPAPAAAGQLDYALRATWKDFLIARSSTTAALRIAEMADSRRYSGSLGGQYPVFGNLRVGPDLSFEFAEVQEQWTYKPSMRFEYLQNRLRLDFRMGLEISDLGVGNAVADRTGVTGVFYKIGYRYDF